MLSGYNHAHYILNKDTAPKSTTTMLGNNLRGGGESWGVCDETGGGGLMRSEWVWEGGGGYNIEYLITELPTFVTQLFCCIVE